MKPIRVMLIEKHEAVKVGLRLLLERLPEVRVTGEAASMADGLRAIRVHQPDVVLLDVPLSEPRGLQRVKRVVREFPDMRVIVMSLAMRSLLRESPLDAAISKGIVQRKIRHAGTPPGLTARQRQVLQLIAEEQNTKQIAHKLGISVKTVETHRAHLMERLNVRSIAGLVRYAIRMKLVSAEDCPGADCPSVSGLPRRTLPPAA